MSKRAKNFLEANTPKKPRKSLETFSESQDPSCRGIFGLLGLSTDILATIVHFLSGLNICRATGVCKHWCILFSHQLVWRPLCTDLILLYKPLVNNNYRQVYREFYSATQLNFLIKLTANHTRSHKSTSTLSLQDTDDAAFVLYIQVHNLQAEPMSLIPFCFPKKYKTEELTGINFSWVLRATTKGDTQFCCELSSFLHPQSSSGHHQKKPFRPEDIVTLASNQSTTTPPFQIPVGWLLDELKEPRSGRTLSEYVKERKAGCTLKLNLIYSCRNDNDNFTVGSLNKICSTPLYLNFD